MNIHPIEPLEPRRLLAAIGALDNTFGDHGKTVYLRPLYNDGLSSADLVGDSKVVVFFNHQRGGGNFKRFSLDGTVDESFGANGIVSYSYRHFGFNDALIVQPDGKLLRLYTDYTELAPTQDHIERYTPDGQLDQTFAQNGTRLIKLPNVFDAFPTSDMLRLPSGDILVAWASETDNRYTLRRYAPDGNPDLSFGSHGFVRTGFPASIAPASLTLSRMMLDRDGKIILIGDDLHYDKASDTQFATGAYVVRLTPDGKTDPTFGQKGVATVKLHGSVLSGDFQGNNIIVSATSGDAPLLLRFTSTGRLDPTFGKAGRDVPFHSRSISNGYEMAVQQDGHLLLALRKFTSSDQFYNDILVARLNSAGALDPTFGNHGTTQVHLGLNSGPDSFHIQNDGGILLFGGTDAGTVESGGSNMFIMRFIGRRNTIPAHMPIPPIKPSSHEISRLTSQIQVSNSTEKYRAHSNYFTFTSKAISAVVAAGPDILSYIFPRMNQAALPFNTFARSYAAANQILLRANPALGPVPFQAHYIAGKLIPVGTDDASTRQNIVDQLKANYQLLSA